MAIPGNNLELLRNALSCPLSYELFEDPVTEGEGTCGHTFENSWIRAWLDENQTCPLSREPLSVDQLVRYSAIKEACLILDPNRVAPIVREQFDEINAVITDIGARVLVSEAVHHSLGQRVKQQIEWAKEKFQGFCC
ncbi:MAG: hypothetical protein P0S93_06215 [Candidatus Neptunochlamydia sp.]|nr:hypothetical protein [Candidatus Neptunochlamydia sp.]